MKTYPRVEVSTLQSVMTTEHLVENSKPFIKYLTHLSIKNAFAIECPYKMLQILATAEFVGTDETVVRRSPQHA